MVGGDCSSVEMQGRDDGERHLDSTSPLEKLSELGEPYDCGG